jgi:threonine/homoserine/homoserine lactone efflux protein
MNEIWPSLIPILLTDIVNPVLFAFMVYAAGTDRPIANSSAMLLGHTMAYFTVGILLSAGMEQAIERLNTPKPIDYYVQLAIGFVILWVALRSRNDTGKRPDESAPQLGFFRSFGYGAVVNFIGIPFAVPYFAALGQILKADFSTSQAVLAVAFYNLAYAVPFSIVPILRAVLGERSQPLLQKINTSLDKASSFLMPILLTLVALVLLADAVYYFATGSQLLTIG